MTKRLDALEECLAKVEAGTVDHGSFMQEWRGSPSYSAGCGVNAHKAYDGSLDAAKALHEAVLGNPVNVNFSQWANGDYVCTLFGVLHDDAPKWAFVPKFESRATNPARAWLIAILKALISEATQ